MFTKGMDHKDIRHAAAEKGPRKDIDQTCLTLGCNWPISGEESRKGWQVRRRKRMETGGGGKRMETGGGKTETGKNRVTIQIVITVQNVPPHRHSHRDRPAYP